MHGNKITVYNPNCKNLYTAHQCYLIKDFRQTDEDANYENMNKSLGSYCFFLELIKFASSFI